MTVTLTVTAADGATTTVALPDPVVSGSGPVAAATAKLVRFGGGGYESGIHLADDGSCVIRADVFGAWVWPPSAGEATPGYQVITKTGTPPQFIFPFCGSGVYEIQFCPNNSSILYMARSTQGSTLWPGGYQARSGVFKSIDGGLTWTAGNPGFPLYQTPTGTLPFPSNSANRNRGPKMAVDPANPNVVYVGTAGAGVFATTDGGNNWTKITNIPASGQEHSGLVIDVSSGPITRSDGVVASKVVYIPSYGNGVWCSTDGGVTFAQLAGAPTAVLAAAVSSAGYFCSAASTNVADLWRYAGVWAKLYTGAAEPNAWNGAGALTINPDNPLEIVLANGQGQLKQSLDGGNTFPNGWTPRGDNGVLTSRVVPWLNTPHPYLGTSGVQWRKGTRTLYIAGSAAHFFLDQPLPLVVGSKLPAALRWSAQVVNVEEICVNEMIKPPGVPTLLVAGWDWGIGLFPVDKLDTYNPNPMAAIPNLGPVQGTTAIDYAKSDPNFILAYIANEPGPPYTSSYSTDGGKTWTNLATPPTTLPASASGGSVAVSTPQNFIFSPCTGSAPFYTTDGGKTWGRCNFPSSGPAAQPQYGAVAANEPIIFHANPIPGNTLTFGIAGASTARPVITFVASGASGNQVNIGGTTVETVANLAAVLSASADPHLMLCNYAAEGPVLWITFKTNGDISAPWYPANSISRVSPGWGVGAGGGSVTISQSGGGLNLKTVASGSIAANKQPVSGNALKLGLWPFCTINFVSDNSGYPTVPTSTNVNIGTDVNATIANLFGMLINTANTTLQQCSYSLSGTTIAIKAVATGNGWGLVQTGTAFTLSGSGLAGGCPLWTGINPNYWTTTRHISADDVVPNTFYLAYPEGFGLTPRYGVYMSTDGGATFQMIVNQYIQLGAGGSHAVRPTPGVAHDMWVGGAGNFLWRVSQVADTWTATKIAGFTLVYCFGFGAPKVAGDYPTVYVRGSYNGIYGLWASTDKGATWTFILDWPLDWLCDVKGLTGDMEVYGRVYLGAPTSGVSYVDALA